MKSILAFLFMALACVSHSQTTVFYYTSEPGTWVGQGKTDLITPKEWSIAARVPYPNTTVREQIQFNFKKLDNSPNWWTVSFAAPAGNVLEVGKTYQATRFPFQTTGAGLDFSGSGRGNNELTGTFTVLEYTWSENTLISAAFDFKQMGDHGSIRYNSKIPVRKTPEVEKAKEK